MRPTLYVALAASLALVVPHGVVPTALAQTAGEGTINGIVTDANGAVIPGATVTATNDATNVATTRTASSSGVYVIAPLPPGSYTLTVAAPGFKHLQQQHLAVDALGTLTVNPMLSVGEVDQTVTVTEAPPVLNTANATLGLVMENETFSNLPLVMNNAQRDPTSFGALTPGAQGGTRLPIVGGTGNFLGQLYLDGLPAETISQQGDNRLVSQTLSVDAVDQFQMVTSTPPAEFQGAGSMNFTMKSGGTKYHGQVSDFIRNTIFDAWCFTCKAATVKNAAGATVPAPKPYEHQNEFSASVGGFVPFTHKKLFFFAAYDRYHDRFYASPSLFTIPSTLMRTGDFTEIANASNSAFLYDPTSTHCVGSVCTRQPFQGIKNGLPTNNVIPASYISPIAQAMQGFLPAPTNSAVTINNYLGSIAKGFDNHLINVRVDYDISSKQRVSGVLAMGTVNYYNNYGSPYIPGPYIGGDLANIYPKVYDVEDVYSFNDKLTNQLKFGFTRFFQDIHNATQGVKAWEPTTLGITNAPAGQAGEEFPGASFATTAAFGTAMTTWTGNSNAVSTQLTTPNNFTLVDNLQWLKGKHAITFGLSMQWQEINNANPATFTGVLDLGYNAFSTANFATNSNALTTGTATTPSGFSYASFLLGAVGGTPSIGLQPVSELGGRYRPISPYIEDSYKVTSKLTLDLGLRWDYFPPFHEVKDRWTFLNPTQTNGATGNLGQLQFAGNYGGAGVSCGCRTPVQTYWKNWGPRIGLAYSVDDKLVFRAGFGTVYSQAGGVGGRVGAANGTGQTGFNVTATGPSELTSGAAAGPSFYLNNGAYFTSAGLANTSLFGAGYSYPVAPTPGAASQILNSGNYLDATNKLVTAAGVAYADPVVAGRAPEFNVYNVGLQRAITNNMSISVNYVGNQSHFLATGSNARGYWAGQLNPAYLAALGSVKDSTGTKPILISAATPANVAKAQAAMPGVNIPTFFQNAASANPSSSVVTIAHGLVAFPQYSGVADTWGNVANLNYSSLQIVLEQRTSHGLSFNINYTYSRNVGDDGSFRSGFDIPAAAISGGTQNWKQDRIDRSWTTVSSPESLHAYGVYQLPFGKNGFGANSLLVRSLAGGWQLSGIYTYASGTPMAITWSGCNGSTYPGQGQCMPDLNPSFSGSARINGSYGTSPNGTTTCNLGIGTGCAAVKYVDANAFSTPANVSTTSTAQYLIGNAPRTRALNLRNPGTQNLDASLRRSFALPESMSFVVQVDVLNAWNKVTFGSPNATWGGSAFGTISGVSNTPRDFQLAAHFNF
ncbi:MAG: TonB-dependent receptor [Acidobacteriota bacterium]|nr:TonB-dependent receptor [Acidobacteriota bacterium]